MPNLDLDQELVLTQKQLDKIKESFIK